MGSPPLTRGKGTVILREPELDGITPAYAGKSPRQADGSEMVEDHPRLRGEKSIITFTPSEVMGSPPLTRGKESSVFPVR